MLLKLAPVEYCTSEQFRMHMFCDEFQVKLVMHMQLLVVFDPLVLASLEQFSAQDEVVVFQ